MDACETTLLPLARANQTTLFNWEHAGKVSGSMLIRRLNCFKRLLIGPLTAVRFHLN